MSAAHSGKFARTDFTKTGFAAAGPEHARAEGVTKQNIHRIKGDPRAAEAALVAWGL